MYLINSKFETLKVNLNSYWLLKNMSGSCNHSCLSFVVLLSCQYDVKLIHWKISLKKSLFLML